MEDRFEEKVAAFSQAYGLFDHSPAVLVAASGGADSTALLHILHTLRGVFKLNLVCAHVNHRLRGPDSDADECFVQSQAGALGLPFVSKSLDVTGFAKGYRLSLETAARHLRMQALLEMARNNHCQAIATGHQKNDNAETVVHRMIRGTGLRGLAGIWPSRTSGDGVHIIRPLLCATRREVVQYLRERYLFWREDATNADCRFRRNAIRNRLLPVLQEEMLSSLVDTLSGLALSTYGLYAKTILPAVDRLRPSAASCFSDRGLSLNIKAIEGQPPYIQIELMRQTLTQLGCGEKDLTGRHYTRLLALAAAKTTDKAVSLPRGFIARRQGDILNLRPPCPSGSVIPDDQPVTLAIPGKVRYGRYIIEVAILSTHDVHISQIREDARHGSECLDWDALRPPLVIRRRRPGDRFLPLGQPTDKKVGKFLTDARIPKESRDEVLVVEDQERIVWLCPVRISDRVKATNSTRLVLEITVRPTEG